MSPDIQKQLHFHRLAREAAIRGRELAEAGRIKEARKVAREAMKYEAEWRRYGGTGPLT